MSEPKYQDETLQRLIDSDLSPDEEAALRAELAHDATGAEALARLERLGSLMQAASQELQTQVDSEALFARIQAGLEADADPAPVKVPTAATTGQRESLWARIFGHRAWIPATGLAALAAAVLMTIYRPVSPDALETGPGLSGSQPPPSESAEPERAATPSETPAAAPEAEAAALPEPTSASSEVVQVDFGDNAGTVFDVALSGGASTPVIWINDEE